MSEVLNLLRRCNKRATDHCVIVAVSPNSIYSNGINRKCWDVINISSNEKPYSDGDGDSESDWLLARCYSASELKEFLRHYGRDEA